MPWPINTVASPSSSTTAGSFVWVLLESTEDAAVWLDLETSDDVFDNWLEAFEDGNQALMTHIDDELIGPVNASPDVPEDDE
jgi:hypothetical protein